MLLNQDFGEEYLLSLLGRVIGKAIAEAAVDECNIEETDLEGLRVVLENVLSRIMRFEADMEGGRLKTRSNCPIHKVYGKWCEEGCIPFIESFTKAINPKIKVKRVSREPGRCEFEFSISE